MENNFTRTTESLRDYPFNDETEGVLIAIITDRINDYQGYSSHILRGQKGKILKELVFAMNNDRDLYELFRDAYAIASIRQNNQAEIHDEELH